jgi:hypothetical protein
VRVRIVSGHVTQNGQSCKCKTFNFLPQVRWKMRACGTGRKFAEYDQRNNRDKQQIIIPYFWYFFLLNARKIRKFENKFANKHD